MIKSQGSLTEAARRGRRKEYRGTEVQNEQGKGKGQKLMGSMPVADVCELNEKQGNVRAKASLTSTTAQTCHFSSTANHAKGTVFFISCNLLKLQLTS